MKGVRIFFIQGMKKGERLKD